MRCFMIPDSSVVTVNFIKVELRHNLFDDLAKNLFLILFVNYVTWLAVKMEFVALQFHNSGLHPAPNLNLVWLPQNIL